MKHLFAIRQFFQKNNVKHWQFLLLGFSISIFSAIFWYYYTAITEINFIIIPLFAALIQGFFTYIFMDAKGEARKVFFSLLFSFITFFLGKYLLFEQYYDWILNSYVDKNNIDLGLILFYFKAMNIESMQLFASSISLIFSAIDLLWIVLIILFSLLYFFLPFEEKNIYKNQNPRKIFRKRRFE